jgi:hypothetical protein
MQSNKVNIVDLNNKKDNKLPLEKPTYMGVKVMCRNECNCTFIHYGKKKTVALFYRAQGLQVLSHLKFLRFLSPFIQVCFRHVDVTNKLHITASSFQTGINDQFSSFIFSTLNCTD